MRTGSLTLSPTPAGSSIERFFALFELLLEILSLFQDFDSRDVQARQYVVEFGACFQVARQHFRHFVVQNVAFLLTHLHEPLKPAKLFFTCH